MNIFLIGPTGAGKTTVAHGLAEHYHQTAYDSDALIAERAGMSIADIFSRRGEKSFRRMEEEIIDELTKKQDAVVAIGAGAALNQRTRRRLKERGACIYLRAQPRTLCRRLEKERAGRPLLAQRPLLPTLKEMDRRRHPLYHEIAHLHIDVDHLSARQTMRAIIRDLERA